MSPRDNGCRRRSGKDGLCGKISLPAAHAPIGIVAGGSFGRKDRCVQNGHEKRLADSQQSLALDGFRYGLPQHITEEALGFDGIVTQLCAEFLAKLADVAFDHIFFDIIIEKAINSVEDLRLRQAPTAVDDQIFENTPLTARQRQRRAINDRIGAVKENLNGANRGGIRARFHAPTNGLCARQYFAHMHGFAHDIIDAGAKQAERLFE